MARKLKSEKRQSEAETIKLTTWANFKRQTVTLEVLNQRLISFCEEKEKWILCLQLTRWSEQVMHMKDLRLSRTPFRAREEKKKSHNNIKYAAKSGTENRGEIMSTRFLTKWIYQKPTKISRTKKQECIEGYYVQAAGKHTKPCQPLGETTATQSPGLSSPPVEYLLSKPAFRVSSSNHQNLKLNRAWSLCSGLVRFRDFAALISLISSSRGLGLHSEHCSMSTVCLSKQTIDNTVDLLL